MRSPIEEHERRSLFSGREGLDPDKYFFVRLRITPADGLTLEEAAARILIISTLRTIRKLVYETYEQRAKDAGFITSTNPAGNEFEIALPIDYCSMHEGMTHLLLMISAAAEYNYTKTFWIESIELPKSFVHRYKGPRFGVSGIRTLAKIEDRPIIGLVIKPRSGIYIQQNLEIASKALSGGVDFLVDDLLMADPDGELNFRTRIRRFVQLVQQLSKDTGETKLYFANIGLSPLRAIEYADLAIKQGVNGVMVNAFTMGIGGVENVVEHINGRIPVIATNMGSGVMTRGTWLGKVELSPTGMSEAVIAKLSRIAGVDAVHIGTSASECYGEDAWGPARLALDQRLFHIKRAMAVAEGDLTVTNLWENILSLGRNTLVEATSGIINYPGGPEHGGKAFRILANNLFPEMGLEEAHKKIQLLAHQNKILRNGLLHFGYSPPNKK